MLFRKNSIYRAWAESQAHSGKVPGGVKRAQILHTEILAAHIKRNLKTIGRTNAHAHV